MSMHTATRHPFTLFAAVVGLLFALAVFTLPHDASSQSSVAITGYLWSDTIGWIDLNCANSDSCSSSNFGLSAASDGTISGYAWSDNVGWISANSSDVSGCPTTPCTPQIDGASVVGWLKARAAGGDGWDGWIKLSGSGYGVTLSQGNFGGYAWGSDVIGWVDWSRAHTQYGSCAPAYSCSDPHTIVYTDSSCVTETVASCTPPTFCSVGSSVCLYPQMQVNGHLRAVPQVVPVGNTVTVSWDVQNVDGCAVSGDNGDSWSGATGSHTSSPIMQRTIYTLTCTTLDQSTFTESATVNTVPVFQER